jgi:nicotinate-nucleotide adenylyltransferase
MRLGVFGGTFDPVHLGHLVLAEQARTQLGLERVLFIPAGDPWRKAGQPITPSRHRLAMVDLAVADNSHFEVDQREIRREGPSYTVETLRELRAEQPDADLFLILGADALADLPNWHEPEGIVAMAMLAVAPRLDGELETPTLASGRVVSVDMPRIEISATDLRERARRGQSLRYLVPSPVETYIRQHGLYRA